MDFQRYWKLLRIGDQLTRPLLSIHATMSLVMHYSAHEWVYPEIGKLFVYDSLDSACTHLRSGLAVFECNVMNPTRPDFKWVPNFPNMVDAREFWPDPQAWEDKPNSYKWIVPEGTVLVDGVRLTGSFLRPGRLDYSNAEIDRLRDVIRACVDQQADQ